MRKPLLATTAGLLLLAAGPAALLSASGCSAAKNVINANIPDVQDPLRLQGRSIKTRVVRSRVFVPATGQVEPSPITFNDINIPSRGSLNSGTISQSLTGNVAVAVPAGGALPEVIRLRNFRLIITLVDSPTLPARRMQIDMTVSGDVVNLTRTTNTDAQGRTIYTMDNAQVVFSAPLDNNAIDHLTSILATPNEDGSTVNTVTGEFTCEIDDETLPTGTTELNFIFGEGKAEVKI